jgi:hypothetical protein
MRLIDRVRGVFEIPHFITLTLIAACSSLPRMVELLRMFELWFILLQTIGLLISASLIGVPFPILVFGAWPASIVFMFFDAAPGPAYLPKQTRCLFGVLTIITYCCMNAFVLTGVVPTDDVLGTLGMMTASVVDFAISRSYTLMVFFAEHTLSSFLYPDRCVVLHDKRPLLT